MSTQTSFPAPSPAEGRALWRYIFAGLCASLIGIGLARFAYTPLIPPLIQEHWFSASDVVYLGAANLAGYLFGALLARPLASRLSKVNTLRLMMVLITAAFLACSVPLSVAWFFSWRFVSGVAGGSIMVLVAATLLPHIPAARKGLAGGAIFLGLGLGIAGSGTIVPLLINFGLRETWIGLGVVSAILTAASWFAWPASSPSQPKPAGHAHHAVPAPQSGLAINVFYGQYALMSLGLVPPMVFLVDFVARGLGAGTHLGAVYWILYGVGAIFGPPLYGLLADRVGPRPALRGVFLVQALAVACLFTASDHMFIGVLTVVIGTFPPGVVPLALARIHELVPNDTHRQNVVWSRATTIFAAAQAMAAYAYSAIFNASGGNHRLLFLIAGIAFAVVLLIDLGVRTSPRPERRA